MFKKKMTIAKLMLSFAMALALCLGTATPAFATTEPPQATGTEGNPAKAAITKILTLPVGMATPTEVFEFILAPVSVDGDKVAVGDTTPSSMPYFPNTIKITIDPATPSETKEGLKIFAKESAGSIFDTSNLSGAWPHAGEFVYTVTEFNNTASTNGFAYSRAEYEFRVYVANGTNGLYIAAITALPDKNDIAGTIKNPGKVDPTPGGGGSSGNGLYSGVIFNNYYPTNTDRMDPREPGHHDLRIGKEVVGPYADRTLYFGYNLKIRGPGNLIGVPETFYIVYVVEKDGDKYKVVTTEKNMVSHLLRSNVYGNYFRLLANGSTYEFDLKHGQFLALVGADLGTQCKVTEKGTPNYIPTAVYRTVDDNGVVLDEQGASDVLHWDLIIPDTFTVSENFTSYAYFKNIHSVSAPGGINVDNLPFVMLIVFAIAALAGYVAFRTRKAAKAGK